MAEMLSEQILRQSMAAGCEKLCRLAVPLYGVSGRSVWFTPKYDIPMALKSVREVLEDLHLENAAEELGLSLVRDAAQKTGKNAGSGAATCIVLTQAILERGMRSLAAGANPVLLRKGIMQAADEACRTIQSGAFSADEQTLAQVMQTAVPDERAVQMVLEASKAVGADSVIQIEDSQRAQSVLEAGGIRYAYGYASRRFSNDATGTRAVLQQPYILLADEKLESILPLEKLLTELIAQDAQFLIIAREFGQELLGDLLSNVQRGAFRLVAAIAPGHGEVRRRNMQALALACGAKLWTKELSIPLERCGLEICGRAGCAEIGKETTAIFDAQSRDAAAVSQMLRSLRGGKETHPENAENYELAISILTGGGARILAGGTTEIEMFERKRNMELALSALRCAQKGGVVPGGGTAYLIAALALQPLISKTDGDVKDGVRCLQAVLQIPTALLAENVGESGSYVVQKILARKETGYGFDCRQKRFCNLQKAGILDAAEGCCLALQTAAETACSILTTSAGVLQTK